MSLSFVVIVVGTLVAGFIQGLSSFGFSLVAMSFWAWVIDPKLDAYLFKLFIGALLAIWCPIMLASKWVPSRSINSPWLNTAVGTVGGVMGIEPTTKAWEAFVLPLNYTRTALLIAC